MFKIKADHIKKIGALLAIKGKRLLFYHQDADGVCSAALMLKFFDFEPYVREGPHLEQEFIKFIVQKQPNLVLFLDLSIDQEADCYKHIEQALPDTKFLIIDHHLPDANLNSPQTLHINPMFDQTTYLPTSWIVYQILSNLKKPANIWIAAIGIVGDYAFKECADFLKKCSKSFPKISFERGAELISAAITMKGTKGAKYALSVLIDSKKPDDFLSNNQLLKWHTDMESEINRILSDFEKNKEVLPDLKLIIYELKSKYNITSIISSVATKINPGMIILIRKETENGWKISMRVPEWANAADLVKKAVVGIGIGGGHKRAAGGFVENWDEFKKRLITELKILLQTFN
jgi:single-stranded DNA-specific DHH superfamily exonuclease